MNLHSKLFAVGTLCWLFGNVVVQAQQKDSDQRQPVAAQQSNERSAEPSDDTRQDGQAEAGEVFDAIKADAPKPVAAEKKYRYWTTDWDFEGIDVGQVVDRLGSIGIELPVAARGTVTVRFKVSVPLNALRTAEAYKIVGRIESPSLTVAQLNLSRFESDVSLVGGVLQFDQTRGTIGDVQTRQSGNFNAIVRATVATPDENAAKPATINAAVDGVPIRPIAELIDRLTGRDAVAVGPAAGDDASTAGSGASEGLAGDLVDGAVTGKIIAAGDLRSISDFADYRAAGNVRVEGLRWAELPPLSVRSGDFVLDGGSLRAESIEIDSTDGSRIALRASVDASLLGQRSFEFMLRGNDLPLQPFSSLVDGKVDVDLNGSGSLGQTIDTGQWRVEGRLASPGIRVAGQSSGLIEHRLRLTEEQFSLVPLADEADREMNLRSIEANYDLRPEKIALNSLDANLYGGEINGSAAIARTDDGIHEIDLRWSDIAPKIDRGLLRQFIGGGVDLISGANGGLETTAVSMQTGGAIDWRVPADRIDDPSAHVGTATIDVNSLAIGGSEVGSLELTLASDGSSIDVNGDGSLFGGTVSVTTVAATPTAATWGEVAGELAAGLFEIKNLRLGRLMPIVRPADRRRYEGLISASFDAEDGGLDGSIVNFTIADQIISRRLMLDASVVDGMLRVRELSGRYAGGSVTATGQWNLFGDGLSRLRLRLGDVAAGRGLMPITDQIAKIFDGDVSGVVTVIGGGSTVTLRGRLTSRETVVTSLPLGVLTTPVVVSVGPSLQRWSVEFPSIRGNSHGGMMVGDLAFRSSGGGVGFDMDGDFGARHVDFGEILGAAGMTSSFAHGDISGALRLGGTRIRGVNDLRGRFDADLETATGAAIPGLAEASRFFTGLSLASTRLTDGNIRGSIGNGALRIEEFTARSEQILIVAEGRVGLRDLRMDVETVISTGNFTTTSEVGPRIIRRFAIDAILPGATLLEIGRLISNRTVYLSVTGPVQDPVVRLQPLETAQAAVRRLAVDQLIPLITGGAAADGLYGD